MDASANKYTDNVTLTFLANPMYHRDVTRVAADNLAMNKKERKFYRKRLLALNRDLLKGNSDVEKSLQKAHDGFVRAAIQHFKMVDRKDILQKQYPSDDVDDDVTADMEFDMQEANAALMRTVEPHATLDNFVTTKTIKIDPGPAPPKKKEINLKSDDLRTKGVKAKKNKKKEKKEKKEKKMS